VSSSEEMLRCPSFADVGGFPPGGELGGGTGAVVSGDG
jgi:hypothetical protein